MVEVRICSKRVIKPSPFVLRREKEARQDGTGKDDDVMLTVSEAREMLSKRRRTEGTYQIAVDQMGKRRICAVAANGGLTVNTVPQKRPARLLAKRQPVPKRDTAVVEHVVQSPGRGGGGAARADHG